MALSLGLVIPAYKPDVERLAEYVFALEQQLEPEQIRLELDSPDDVTLDRLQTVPAVVNAVPYRRGKGAAITAGFEALDTDVYAFSDADGSTPPDQVEKVLKAITHGRADLAVGSRRHPDAEVETHQTTARKYLGDSFAWLARRLLPVRLYDYQCGTKAITRDGWERIRRHLYASGFSWDIELLAMAHALELSISEIPIEWHDRPESTVSPIRTSLSLARTLVVARHRSEKLRDSRLHTALSRQQNRPEALVDRER